MIPNFDPNKLVYDNTFNKRQLSMSKTDFDKMANGFAQNMSVNVKSQNKIKEWLASADRKTYVYGYTDYLRLDMRNSLKNINLPVTIIAAALPYGKNRVRQTYQNQYRNLEKYDFIIADNSAHFIMFDEPDWFLKQIKKSLTLN